jgi:3',5'-cyclic AMP phosphodiesterase CpdA
MKQHNPDFCVINGDLSEFGTEDQIAAVQEIFGTLGVPLYFTVGNHDYNPTTGRAAYEKLCPNSINYSFEHQGWQFVGLDSTEGRLVVFTRVQPATFQWLDANLPSLDRNKPTILLTHFPMGNLVLCRPLNAEDLLKRFDGYNLRAAFNGHWHGYAERTFEHASITNSRCGSWWRLNNDGSPDKGYFLCETTATGDVRHQFCVVA